MSRRLGVLLVSICEDCRRKNVRAGVTALWKRIFSNGSSIV